jgi:hypothetical protein
MNVSSVKNLNGETFSAVQDAALTDVVQTNSGNWQDITAYQNASAGYITAVDLSNYYTKSETSGADEIANALSNIPTGNPEVENYVQTNSGAIDDVTTAYQNASSTYLTALPNTASIHVLSARDSVNVGYNALYNSYAYIDRNGMYFKNGTDRPYNIGIDSTGSNFYIATAKKGYTRIYASSISGWNDVLSTYQNASATYLTAVDLTPYATTAEVESISSMLSGAIDYVSANAGDEFPVSADEAIQYVQTNSGTIDDTVTSYQTNSGTFLTAHQAISAEEWNDCYDNVNTNSGAWGGSALPISAGPGIKVNLVDNTLVFSNDETVLWSGEPQKAPITLSESYKNFKELKIVGRLNDSNAVGTVASWRFDTDIISANPYLNCQSFVVNSTENSAYGAYLRNSVEVVSSDTGIGHWHTFSYSYTTANQITMQTNDEWGKLWYYKVIGIGRIAGGN